MGTLWKRHMIVEIPDLEKKYEYPPWGIQLRVSLDTTPQANTAEAKLWNLSTKTLGALKRGLLVELSAGYEEDSVGLIFAGILDKVQTKIQDVDKITTLTVSAGKGDVYTVHPALSWQPGITAQKIVEDLFRAAGVGVKDVEVPGDVRFEKGYVCDPSGSVADWLNQIKKDVELKTGEEYEWFVDNGYGFFRPRRKAHNTTVVLKKETGLIGTPEPLNVATADVAASEGEPTQWKIVSTLNWRIEPGGKIKVESRRVSGTMKVVRLVHTATPDGKFETEIVADAIDVEVRPGEELEEEVPPVAQGGGS